MGLEYSATTSTRMPSTPRLSEALLKLGKRWQRSKHKKLTR